MDLSLFQNQSHFLLRLEFKGIKTDSRAPGEPKETEGSALFQLYQAFATAEETEAMRRAFADGIGWGEAKQQLFERIDREVAPMREKYDALIANPIEIEATLREGADKARKIATPFLAELRRAVGLRDLRDAPKSAAKVASKAALPSFKQYREKDGKFYFKLADGEGAVLLQSRGFDTPKEAGALIAALRSGETGFAQLQGAAILGEGIGESDVRAALDALRAADEAKS